MLSKRVVDKDKDKVSVIVPCYNEELNLIRTINSIKKQTYQNIEVIIVNDGSYNLLTKKILNSFKDKKITIINQKNKGLGISRNIGIKKSKGKFVLFLDSDDWLHTNAVEEFVKFLNNNEDIPYVYSNIVNKNQSNAVLIRHFNFFEQLFSNQIPYSIFIRRNVLFNIGLYDEKMPIMGFEDWDLNLRLGAKKFYGACINKNLFYYNVSEDGMLKSLSLKNFITLYLYIRNKNKDLYKFKNILKIYFKFYKVKSTHTLILYFFYNFLFSILSSKVLNYLIFIFFLFLSPSRNKMKPHKKLFFSKKR